MSSPLEASYFNHANIRLLPNIVLKGRIDKISNCPKQLNRVIFIVEKIVIDKNRQGSRIQLLDNIGKKIDKRWQTTENIKTYKIYSFFSRILNIQSNNNIRKTHWHIKMEKALIYMM